MKKMLKRIVLVCLAAALALPPVFASDALGSDLLSRTVQVGAGVSVTRGSLWSATYSDLRTEHYITYQPGQGASSMLWYGGRAGARSTLTDAAAELAAQGLRVVAGINGGFFNTDGTSVGLVLTDGIIRSMDRKNYQMVGVSAGGTAFVDESAVTMTASWIGGYFGQSARWDLAGINASRANGGLYLFNEDYGASMKNSLGGVDVILQPMNLGQGLRMNSSLMLRVVQVNDSTAEGAAVDSTIPAGCYVLSANLNCDPALLSDLRGMTPGTMVTVEIAGADSRWAAASWGISGLYSLVENGAVVSGLPSGAAPRTALGIRADGSLLFYTIDGRQKGYSVGASYSQTAQRLVELGCVRAVALDGGGSTTLGATLPGGNTFSVLNTPSGGSLRAVSSCIFLTVPHSTAAGASQLYIDPAYRVVLSGSQTVVNVTGADYQGNYAALSGGVAWSSAGGTVSVNDLGETVFAAGYQPGSFELTAFCQNATGSAPIRVVDSLSRLTVFRRDGGDADALVLSPGEQVELGASGTWYNIPVAMDEGSISWAAEGNVGSVDSRGVFTAAAENALGSLTVTAGGRSVTIPVKVDRGDPFTDITGHWSQPYVTNLYKAGVTTGTLLEDGSYVYEPDVKLTRGQLLVFLNRLLKVDTAQYMLVELPFADGSEIPEWLAPNVKALYALGVFNGSRDGEEVYANVNGFITREEAMTMIGRMLTEQVGYDLSVFADGGAVSDWAGTYVQTLVAREVVGGYDGRLLPGDNITRGEIAKILSLAAKLPRRELTARV